MCGMIKRSASALMHRFIGIRNGIHRFNSGFQAGAHTLNTIQAAAMAMRRQSTHKVQDEDEKKIGERGPGKKCFCTDILGAIAA